MKIKKSGFTLIELLIVVAIIAILAAIAIPNFLAAQTRSKVARVQSEMRTLGTGLESYYVDNTMYPWYQDVGSGPNNLLQNNWTWLGIPLSLSTPIAYISNSLMWDPFPELGGNSKMVNTYRYIDNNEFNYLHDNYSWTWVGTRSYVGDWAYPTYLKGDAGHGYLEPSPKVWMLISNGPDLKFQNWFAYDPTNGTISPGDIERFGP
jgi:prepilin-type N-terminal cleavage/methylation domain-containing protein